ncbi:MAG: DHH family phosphoesterase [Bacilli bacterium]|nr:DHH family phosphoesterase [Bacilli bacterium]
MAPNQTTPSKNELARKRQKTSISMADAMRRLRVSTFAFVLIEIVILALALTVYFTKWPPIVYDNMKPEYWIFGSVGVAFVNIMLLWLSEIRLASIRQKSNLDASSVIGNDVQEAYNFGQIGLVVTDENDIVMWTNNLFRERNIDLMDEDIFEWQPALKNFLGSNVPSDMEVKVEANGRFYSVKYISDARLFIFKDCTDYESIFNYSREQGLVIGIIMLDNYSDIAGKTEDDNNDLVSKVRAAIFEYCKVNGVLLRRYRNDSYFVVCNFAALEKMQKDQFKILETVRSLGKGQNVIPTLSIGVAHDFPDVIKLNEMASNAIDIAMSRGGDQAVVSKYGEDLKFYGGKTAAIENTGRVQFRSVADSVIGIIRESSNVIVSGHMDMDMDALGSCLGVMAICNWCKKPCQIVFDPKLTEKKTRYAFQRAFPKQEFERMVITPKEAEDKIRASTLFVVVDVSVPNRVMGMRALEKASKTIVIDHHRRGENFVENPVLNYVDPSASSASEILAEFIHYATANPRIEIPPQYATIMLSGMFLDTGFFKSKAVGVRTFEAAEILKEFGADNAVADDYLKDEFEEYALVTKIVSTLRTPYTGVCYCVSDERDIVEKSTLAKVANQIMSLKDINCCFVIGRTGENETGLSARSDSTVNVQLLCEKLGGGGHFNMAAASFSNTPVAVIEGKLLDTLDTYLSEAKSDIGGQKI